MGVASHADRDEETINDTGDDATSNTKTRGDDATSNTKTRGNPITDAIFTQLVPHPFVSLPCAFRTSATPLIFFKQLKTAVVVLLPLLLTEPTVRLGVSVKPVLNWANIVGSIRRI